MFKSEMYKYTFVKTASFMSDFVVNKYYNHGAFLRNSWSLPLGGEKRRNNPSAAHEGGMVYFVN